MKRTVTSTVTLVGWDTLVPCLGGPADLSHQGPICGDEVLTHARRVARSWATSWVLLEPAYCNRQPRHAATLFATAFPPATVPDAACMPRWPEKHGTAQSEQ